MPLHLLRIARIVAFRVGHEAIGVHSQEARTASAPDLLDSLEGFVQQVFGLPRVRFERGDAKGRRSREDLPSQRLRLKGALGVEIVLQHDQHRQLPTGSDVERLIQRALPQRAVPDKGHCDIIVARALQCQRHAGGDRRHAALNPVAEEPLGAQMLAPAPATAHPGLATHDLRDQPLHIVGDCNIVPVTTVVTEHHIAAPQVGCHRHPSPFLADAGVDRPKQFALREQVQQGLLHLSDQHRLGIMLRQRARHSPSRLFIRNRCFLRHIRLCSQ